MLPCKILAIHKKTIVRSEEKMARHRQKISRSSEQTARLALSRKPCRSDGL
jgi:hypothetical protein